MTKISIMQGRLLPPFEGRFQAYPAKEWEEEFYAAADLGLYSIEWIYEKPYEGENALSCQSGIEHLKKVMAETGVGVRSICADYYMSEHLIKEGKPVSENWDHLEWLCAQGKMLGGIEYIILPFVDSSSLKTEEDQSALAIALKEFLSSHRNAGIELHLETDLEPHNFAMIFHKVDHPLLKLNYDIGNSASLGYDPDEEFGVLGSYLGSVHVKDRVFQGKTVPLGSGNADFPKCFKWFEALNFNGWYVLQAARGPVGDEKVTTENHINFVKNYLKTYGSRAS